MKILHAIYFCFIKDSEKFCNIEICLILVHHFPSLFDQRTSFPPRIHRKGVILWEILPCAVVCFDGDGGDDDDGDNDNGGDNKNNSNIYQTLIMS